MVKAERTISMRDMYEGTLRRELGGGGGGGGEDARGHGLSKRSPKVKTF